MGWFKDQLKQVLRRLSRAPMFTVVTLVTIAVGVGANTAVFSVLEGVLLKPLPYPHPDELVGVWHSAPAINIPQLPLGSSNYFIYREQNRSFQDIGLYTGDAVNVTGVGEPEHVQSLVVTDGTLPILGVPPTLGRWFSHADDSPGSPDTVMLTYGYWQRKFGGDPAIVGRNITVDGKPRQIIGVMPKGFAFMDMPDPSLILPFAFDRNKTVLGNFSYQAVARLKPGVTLAQSNADVERMLPIVFRSFPAPPGFSVKIFEQVRLIPNVRSLRQDVIGDVGKALWVLMGTIGIVLLIACANVANLLLVRAEGRQQELAIRASLGATWRRLAGEFLIECFALGIAGSVLGLALAYGALRVLVAMAPAGLPRLNEIGIDSHVLLFTLIASLFSSALFACVPMLKHRGLHLGTGLREGGRGLSESRERHRARQALVVVQVALALVLLVSSGLMVRTFRALTHVEPGFAAPAAVQTVRLTIPEADVKDNERVAHMQEQILRKIEAIPGVSSVGVSSGVPMDGNGSFDPVYAQDRTYAEGQLAPLRRFKFISPGSFRTLGTPLVAGRDLTWTDVFEKRPVAIISEAFARDYWHDAAGAMGKQIRVAPDNDWSEIVGVVADVRDAGLDKPAMPTVYWHMMIRKFWDEEPLVRRDMAFAFRTPRAGSESLMKEVRQVVWSVDANLPLADVHTLDYYYKKSMARTSFTLVMLATAAGMALLLGTVGLYGVIAYSVSQRRREIGIRMALGAQQQSVTRMFVRDGLVLTLVGVACGLGAAFAVMRLMTSLLFKVRPVDPLTYVAVSLGLVATSALASFVPSRRAASVNPVEALRAE